jgi:hypothetical protein
MNLPANHASAPELLVLSSLMDKVDRSDPVGEATFSALETAALLLSSAKPLSSGDLEHLELLRQALGAARASVAAASYALTVSADREQVAGSLVPRRRAHSLVVCQTEIGA